MSLRLIASGRRAEAFADRRRGVGGRDGVELIVGGEEEVGTGGFGESALGLRGFAGVERDGDGVELEDSEEGGEPVGAVGAGEGDEAATEEGRNEGNRTANIKVRPLLAESGGEGGGAGVERAAGVDFTGGGFYEGAGVGRGGDEGLPGGEEGGR